MSKSRKRFKGWWKIFGEDGSQGRQYWIRLAVYDEIVDEKKITYTMTDGRQATTIFETIDGNKTKVTTTFDPDKENPIKMQKGGWQAIINNFKEYVETI